MNSIIRLDTRGRLVIPNEFRETLDLKEGDIVRAKVIKIDQQGKIALSIKQAGESCESSD